MSDKNAGRVTDMALVPQPNGRGALRRGNPGNRGGGRPPSAVRRELRRIVLDNIHVLEGIAQGVAEGVKPSDQVAAFGVAARIGLGEAANLEDVRERLRAQIALIKRQKLWSTPDLLDQLEKIWR